MIERLILGWLVAILALLALWVVAHRIFRRRNDRRWGSGPR